MEAPRKRLSQEQFNQAISRHVARHYRRKGKGYVCKTDGASIKQTTCYVSVHTNLFPNCAGGGEVRTTNLPYCPKCEGAPKNTSTCVHE
jgi:hypothetical protein